MQGITGVHVVLYSAEYEALRTQLHEVFGWPVNDAIPGMPLYALPPGELGVHPIGDDQTPHHEFSLICDDVAAVVSALHGTGVEILGEPQLRSFGTTVMLRLAGGVEVLLYQPSYPRPS